MSKAPPKYERNPNNKKTTKKNYFDGNFGVNLKKQRESNGYKQETIAEKVGISPSVWSEYENGYKIPSLETAYKIAIELKISLDELLGLPTKIYIENYAEWIINVWARIIKDGDRYKYFEIKSAVLVDGEYEMESDTLSNFKHFKLGMVTNNDVFVDFYRNYVECLNNTFQSPKDKENTLNDIEKKYVDKIKKECEK